MTSRYVRRFFHDLVQAGVFKQVTNESGEPGYSLVVHDMDEFEFRLRQYFGEKRTPAVTGAQETT
jgi:hypothetical protein